MIMYYLATEEQPFAKRAHDYFLALDICKGIRPEVNEQRVPKCYIDLMKKCLDSNPDNRPNSIEIRESIALFFLSIFNEKLIMPIEIEKKQQYYEIEKQFKEAEEYRKKECLSIDNNKPTTHSQAVYVSRLLNNFTKNLPKYGNVEF